MYKRNIDHILIPSSYPEYVKITEIENLYIKFTVCSVLASVQYNLIYKAATCKFRER